MATIKRIGNGNNLRIITKVVGGNRKVSCSCCAVTECCMYPAQALLDGLYTWNDLPDEIIGPDSLIWNKLPEPPSLSYAIAYESEDNFNGEQTITLDPDFEIWSAIAGTETNACLIDPQGWGFDDTFSDTYEIQFLNPNEGQSAATVTRVSLCVWEDPANGVSLEYQNIGGEPVWLVDSALGSYSKNGFQNSPEGVYGTFEDVIVSAP